MDLHLPTPLDVLKGMLNAVKHFFAALVFLLVIVPLFHWGIFVLGIVLVLFGYKIVGFICVAIGLIALCVSAKLRI